MIGLGNSPEQFFTMYLIVLSLSFAGTSLGLLIGSTVTDPTVVHNLPTVAMFPFLMFSGFFKNNGNLPVWIGWIRYISPFNYCFTALV
jgi:ABC-type multidrug transport system permease subunit